MSDEPRLIMLGPAPFLLNAPEGHCPHGEALCDDDCGAFSGCKMFRPPTETP